MPKQGDMSPPVSVVMPVRNEGDFIRRSLGAVLAQDYARDCLEVLVVDGMSDDETRAIVTEIAASDARVRMLDNPARIVPTAMNIGIAAARGEIIVRVDGHTLPEPDYVTRCVYHLQQTGADNVGGPMQPAGLTPMGEAIAAATSAPFGIPTRFHHSRTPGYVDTVYMGAWPRAVFERVGGFDETLIRNQDYELNYRIRQHGGRIYYAPDIRATYYGRQTLRALARQYFQYGVWKVHVIVRHPASTRPRHLVAPAFVMALAAGAALTPFTRRGWWLLAAVAGSYALANLVASTQLAMQRGWRLLLRVPAVFATIHVAWGAGFWRGVLQQARGLASRCGAGRPS
ncbi:MAG: glycosyltransferase family 2 protein [Anaerolineae bacterium]|nr:glycosyltransferase family 2 protein [Anaerolineae bacterium]